MAPRRLTGVAMDLFSQAEHDELAQSICCVPDADYMPRCNRIDRLLPTMPRAEIIRASLEGQGALIPTRNMEEATSATVSRQSTWKSANEPHKWSPCSSMPAPIFLGAYTSESLGDIAPAPTTLVYLLGTARFSSPLGCMTSKAFQPD